MFFAEFLQSIGEDGKEDEDVLGLSVNTVNTEEGSTHAERVSRSSPSGNQESLCTVSCQHCFPFNIPSRTHFSKTISISLSSKPRPFCTCPTNIRSKKFLAVALVGSNFSPCNTLYLD